MPARAGASLVLIRFCRGDELPEQGMGLVGPALELRVELDAHEPGVVRPLHDLHQAAVGGETGQGQAAVSTSASRNWLLNS